MARLVSRPHLLGPTCYGFHVLHGCPCHGQALKLPCALREFEAARAAGITDAPKPPTIVGFREHIFSGLGLLGDLAASSELCFGTLVQALSPRPLTASSHLAFTPRLHTRVFIPASSHPRLHTSYKGRAYSTAATLWPACCGWPTRAR